MSTLARIDVVGLEAPSANELPPKMPTQSAWVQMVGRAPRSFSQRSHCATTPMNADWIAQHSDVLAWIYNNENNFANSLRTQYEAKGQLSTGQVDAVREQLGDPEAKARRQAARAASAPSVAGAGFDKLLQAFRSAEGTGLKRPMLKCKEIVFSFAKQDSRNPGFVYVKIDGTYKGKISPEGRFMGSGASQDETAEVMRIGRDPLAAAIEHGKLTGKCAICSRVLDNPESVARGIGPICAKKFGW